MWLQYKIQKAMFKFWGKVFGKGMEVGEEYETKKAKAGRNGNGTPICRECEKRVEEDTKTCPNCEGEFYTYRGRIARIGCAVYGFACLMSPFMFGVVQAIFLVPLGVLLIYLWIQFRRDMPLRELHVREKLPSV